MIVDLRERPPLRPVVRRGMHDDAARLELLLRAPPELVVAEHGEQVGLVCKKGELHRRNAASASRLLPVVERVRDLAGRGDTVDAREANPLDVPDDCGAHHSSVYHVSHAAPSRRFTR